MTTQTGQEISGAEQWHELAQQLRVDSIRSSGAAGSGHPTSSMSAADLMAVLMSKYLRYDFDTPENPANDRLIFSKGHASPLLYSIYKAAGAISKEDLMGFRSFDSIYEGHPTPRIPWVDVATGSLGQGLPLGVGFAMASKHLDKLDSRTWVLCGDSEMAEGSMWEAFQHAAHYKLGNLIAILDMNRLGQTRETMDGWDGDAYADRARAFGCQAIQIDGHDLDAIDDAYAQAIENEDTPTLIVAKTMKGKGVSFVENLDGFHGAPLDPDREDEAVEELGGEREMVVEVQKPDSVEKTFEGGVTGDLNLPSYELGDEEATRTAYGDALKALGAAREDVVAMDGEVSNSTRAGYFEEDFPERYFEMYIAEQQLVATAIAMGQTGRKPFASSFAAFFTRAYDFIRMGAISGANFNMSGSHAGISIGEDGPSQMALEDIAMMRAVHGSTVLQPSDANQTIKLTAEMADRDGIVFYAHPAAKDRGHLRTRRGVRDRGQQSRPLLRRGPGNHRRHRHHGSQCHRGRREARRRRHLRADSGRLLHKAPRRGHPTRGGPGDRWQSSSWPRTIGRRAASVRPLCTSSPRTAASKACSTSTWR